MRLSRDVLLVGGGNLGFNLSHYLDCHVYLIDGGDEFAIVDTGIGGHHGESDTILKNIQDDGVDLDKVSTLLLTHYHTDHAGGAADFRDRLGLNVVGSPLTSKTLEAGDEETISLPFAKKAGFYPADYVYRACPCAPDLIEGKPFKVGRHAGTLPGPRLVAGRRRRPALSHQRRSRVRGRHDHRPEHPGLLDSRIFAKRQKNGSGRVRRVPARSFEHLDEGRQAPH
jgi:hypothetical protein